MCTGWGKADLRIHITAKCVCEPLAKESLVEHQEIIVSKVYAPECLRSAREITGFDRGFMVANFYGALDPSWYQRDLMFGIIIDAEDQFSDCLKE
jgi:hypothetical protein